MIKTIGRFLFYASFVFLVVLLLWEHSTARGWEEIADNAQRAQDKATRVAKVAFDRADRCVGELYKQESVQAKSSSATKPNEPASPRGATP